MKSKQEEKEHGMQRRDGKEVDGKVKLDKNRDSD